MIIFSLLFDSGLKLKVKSLKLSQSKRGFIFQLPLNLASNYLRNFRYSGKILTNSVSFYFVISFFSLNHYYWFWLVM